MVGKMTGAVLVAASLVLPAAASAQVVNAPSNRTFFGVNPYRNGTGLASPPQVILHKPDHPPLHGNVLGRAQKQTYHRFTPGTGAGYGGD